MNIGLFMMGTRSKCTGKPALQLGVNMDELDTQNGRKSTKAMMSERVRCRYGMLALDEAGVENEAIALFMGCSVRTVRRWIRRATQTNDLSDMPRSGCPAKYSEEIGMRIVAFYCQTRPLESCGRWTLKWAAAYLAANPTQIGVCPSSSTIHRILQMNNLKPHLSIYFLQITDPNFFPKMEHLLALFKDPPANLFFFDECPGIQILKRLLPDLQTEETAKRLEEFEYIRNGTMDVFAFLNHADGKVYTECHSNHKMLTFLGVFRRHVARYPTDEPLDYVMDNLACHRSYSFCELVAELSHVSCPSEEVLDTLEKRVQWLKSKNKRIIIHFTPYHGSWLNMVENWFGIMGRKVLGESFGSADELKAAFDTFVDKQWNALLAHPFRWDYDGVGLHEKVVKRSTKTLENSAEQLDVRMLIKMLLLITNLLNDYFDEVPESTWKAFVTVVSMKDEAINNLIEQDKKTKRKRKAEEVLKIFNTAISQRFDLNEKLVA